MEKKIDLSGLLSYDETDLTAPDVVVGEIVSQLAEETNGLIIGKVEPYEGRIDSYTAVTLSEIAKSIGTTTKEVNIQDSLGAIGEKQYRFECYIGTEAYKSYKYRLFFMEYGIAHYPVRLVVERSLVSSFSPKSASYTFRFGNRKELEECVVDILSCKKAISIMQEIIRISQINSQKSVDAENSEDMNE